METVATQKLKVKSFEAFNTHLVASLINDWLQKSNAVIFDVIVFPRGEEVAAIVLYEGLGAKEPQIRHI